jgi:lysophospholipid acyltransferase (LPLAT)-like uncharacterized protein
MRAKILSFIAWIFISIWGATVRVTFVNRQIPERLQAEGNNCIYAFWHGRQFLLLFTHRHSGTVLPSSESRDGEIQAMILKRFGYGVVRGSSKRKGAQALLGLVENLRSGKTIGLAVDGPRGPLYEVKPGLTYLAGKLNKPIVPVITSAKRFWILEKIWDKYLLPVPFTRGIVMYGEPVWVSGTAEKELEIKSAEVQSALNRMMNEADHYFSKQTG